MGAEDPFTCEGCRAHVGASAHESLRRAGDKIERLEAKLDELRGGPADEDRMLSLLDRLRKLHHVVLKTGRCACGKDAKCPTLRIVETA